MNKYLTLGLLAWSAIQAPVYALDIQPYSAPVLMAKQQAGERVSVHLHATWCPTCRAQAKIFQSFQGDASVPGTLLVADYDTERELKRELNVRSQATLIVFQGKTQISRSGGVTEPDQLRAELTRPR